MFRILLFLYCVATYTLANIGSANDVMKKVKHSVSPYKSTLVLALWAGEIPNTTKSNEKEIIIKDKIIRISKVQQPTIEVFLPNKESSTGQAVVIFPGGGYRKLAYDWEGQNIAKWLNTLGIAGIVVKYRLPDSDTIKTRHSAPLMDAKRAIQLTRFNAKRWNIDTDNIGVIGFSAGGHLASTLGTHLDSSVSFKTYEGDINAISNRPDFMALIYPVISMLKTETHMGSRKSLLGPSPTQSLIEKYSNHLQVTKNTPPTFLLHATDDKAVPVENTLKMYSALKAKQVPAEMHIFDKGGHGFSLATPHKSLAKWPTLLHSWLVSL